MIFTEGCHKISNSNRVYKTLPEKNKVDGLLQIPEGVILWFANRRWGGERIAAISIKTVNITFYVQDYAIAKQ
jgi:hypothetical protein